MRTTMLHALGLLGALSSCTIITVPPDAAPTPAAPASAPAPVATPTPTPKDAPASPASSATPAPAASSATPAPAASSAKPPATLPPPSASNLPSSQAPVQGPSDAAILGSWKSASCGARKYERVITFSKEGAFTAEDRVSPCPPKVTCVWSGIISRKGTFTRSGSTITLSTTDAGKGPGGQPLPASLTVDGATSAPAEMDGGKPCPYQR